MEYRPKPHLKKYFDLIFYRTLREAVQLNFTLNNFLLKYRRLDIVFIQDFMSVFKCLRFNLALLTDLLQFCCETVTEIYTGKRQCKPPFLATGPGDPS